MVNAIIFFARNTKNCDTRKLYTLLYFLDFEHYAQTGRSVTGLTYYAYPEGPVPVELDKEIQAMLRGPKTNLFNTRKDEWMR